MGRQKHRRDSVKQKNTWYLKSNHTTSTHIIIAPFVVLIFGLYVDGKLRQKGALEGKRRDNEKSIGSVITVIW